jgi:hypothetical protein
MGGRRLLSTVARSSPEERSGAAVVIGLGCARQGKKMCKWVQCCLLVLLGIRGRGKKQTWARNTAATRWRPADGSGGRGARETG